MSKLTSAKVTVEWTNLPTRELQHRQVTLAYDGEIVRMHGGPTGYESFLLDDYMSRRVEREDTEPWRWVACVGTPGRYARCVVPSEEMKRALIEMGVLP